MRQMDARTPAILGTALALGAGGDYLLRGGNLGVGFSLWAWSALVAYLVLSRRLRIRFVRDALPFAVLAFICSTLVTVRASPTLSALNVGATLAAATLLSLRTRADRLHRAPFVDYLRGTAVIALHATTGALGPLVSALTRVTSRMPTTRSRAFALIRGALLTVPALLFFGILLLAADASFERLVLDIIGIDAWTPLNHLWVIAVITLGFAGVFHGRLGGRRDESANLPSTRSLSLGLVEAGMVVGALDLLFATFVALQIPHFFGGAGTLGSTPGLTAAEYARRGFFELVIVEAMAVPILLGAEAVMRGRPRRHVTAFRILAGINLGLLGAIAASAALRLLLYRSAFGLTESRIYAGAVLVWMGAVLVVLAATVLAGRHERFTFSAIMAGFTVLLALNAVNPDALIASTNLAQAERQGSAGAAHGEGSFDVAYNAGLSADAVPILLEGLGSLNSQDRARLVRVLYQQQRSNDADGWRSWNLARRQAGRALSDPGLGPG
ncbi:MAG: DUF4153 domain-containing protein [Thermoleophilia bacterium]